MQSLQCNLYHAIFAQPTLRQPLPRIKSLESIAPSNHGYARFAMQSLLCNLCRAYLEPTDPNEKINEIDRSEQSWSLLCNLCYAIFAEPTLSQPLSIFAEPTLSQPLPASKANLRRAYMEPTFANEQIIGIHCFEQLWLCSFCHTIVATQPWLSLP